MVNTFEVQAVNKNKHRKSGEIEIADQILHDHNHDGIDRRGFLKCMAWAGTGALLRHERRGAQLL